MAGAPPRVPVAGIVRVEPGELRHGLAPALRRLKASVLVHGDACARDRHGDGLASGAGDELSKERAGVGGTRDRLAEDHVPEPRGTVREAPTGGLEDRLLRVEAQERGRRASVLPQEREDLLLPARPSLQGRPQPLRHHPRPAWSRVYLGPRRGFGRNGYPPER